MAFEAACVGGKTPAVGTGTTSVAGTTAVALYAGGAVGLAGAAV